MKSILQVQKKLLSDKILILENYNLNHGNLRSMIKNKNQSIKGRLLLNTESHNGDKIQIKTITKEGYHVI